MADDAPYLVRLGDAQADAVSALFDVLQRAEWHLCTVDYRKAGSIAEVDVNITKADGTAGLQEPSGPLLLALKRLRDLMASEEGRPWLSVTVTARPDGRVSFDYNYDQRPRWSLEPTDESYIEDLARYPRLADQLPEWYPRPS